MNAIAPASAWSEPVSPEPGRGTCLLCALTGTLAAALMLTVLARMLFLAPSGPTLLPLDETCSLSREACTMRLPDGGTLEISLGPRPIPLLRPLTLEIRISGSNARPVEVDFTGIDVPMAFNRVYLKPGAEGVYAAQAALPLCASGRMAWQASVLLENNQGHFLAPFRFETNRSS